MKFVNAERMQSFDLYIYYEQTFDSTYFMWQLICGYANDGRVI